MSLETLHRRLLHRFSQIQGSTGDDAGATMVDLSSAGGFLEWWHGSSIEERRGLIATTPIRLPFPVAMFGYVAVTPTMHAGGRVTHDHSAVIAGAYAPADHPETQVALAFWQVGPYPSPFMTGRLFLTSDGRLESFTSDPPPADDEHEPEACTMIGAALAMFHVRNIELRPRRVSRRERRTFRRDTGQTIGPVVYHTLEIKPFRRPGESSSRMSSSPSAPGVPLHLVRGHFAHYSADHPLFGKYPGTFWRPSHFAGNRNTGLVRKTYELNLEPAS